MPEPVLNAPRFVAGIRQRIAARVSQHVRVHGKAEAGARADAFNELVGGIRREQPAAFGREHEGRVGRLPAQLAQGPHLVTAERVNARLPILRSPNVNPGGAAELHLRPFQIGDLRGA